MKTTLTITLLMLLCSCLMLRHFRQGDQVCVGAFQYGEVIDAPYKDKDKHWMYRVKVENGFIMHYSEQFLDSLNNY